MLPNENQEHNRKQNLIEMHAKLTTQYFHSNVVSEWNDHSNTANGIPAGSNDDISCNASASTSRRI